MSDPRPKPCICARCSIKAEPEQYHRAAGLCLPCVQEVAASFDLPEEQTGLAVQSERTFQYFPAAGADKHIAVRVLVIASGGYIHHATEEEVTASKVVRASSPFLSRPMILVQKQNPDIFPKPRDDAKRAAANDLPDW